MSLIKWNPFRKMEDFFENYPTELRGGKGEATRAFESWSPIVDISETDKEFLIQAELPGVEKKDINLTIEQGVLTLNGERRFKHKKHDKKHHPIENLYGSFTL